MQITKRQAALLIFGVVFSTLLVSSPIIYVIASSPSATMTITEGIYPGAPSYTIYELSGTYYAKDQNGYNEFSDSDAATVIQDAVDTGLPIYITQGTYPITQAITFTHKTKIYGDTMYNVELQASTGFKVFNIVSKNYVHLSDLTVSISGTDAGSIGIYAEDVTFMEIQNVRVYGGEYAAVFYGVSVYQSVYTENFFVTNAKYGVSVQGKIDEVRAIGLRCFENSVRGLEALSLSGGVLHFVHPDAQNPNAEYGFYFENCANNEIKLEGGGVYGYENNSVVFSGCTAGRMELLGVTVLEPVYRGVWLYETNNVILNGMFAHIAGTHDVDIQNSNNTIISSSYIDDLLEQGTSDYNMIVGSRFQTQAVTSGTNTKVASTYNATTWIS